MTCFLYIYMETYKGWFTPKHPEKYQGNVNNIVFRSGWERKFMQYLDETPAILEWSSEEVIIWYTSPVDGVKHRYFPDFKMVVKTTKGEIKTHLIEIKPKAQTKPPVKKSRNTKKYLTEVMTYGVNQAKWAAAENFCNSRGWTFTVLTEKELGIA